MRPRLVDAATLVAALVLTCAPPVIAATASGARRTEFVPVADPIAGSDTVTVSSPGIPRYSSVPRDKLDIARRAAAATNHPPLPTSRAEAARVVMASAPVPPLSGAGPSSAPTASLHARSLLATPPPVSRVLTPAAFGGDPTGKADSSAAFDRLMAAALTGRPNASVVGAGAGGGYVSRYGQGAPEIDLGGVVVDLAGGAYRLTRPIVTPAMASNYHIRDGTLFADAAFAPTTSAMLEIGSGCTSDVTLCGSDVSVSGVTFHANFAAAGAVAVNSMQFVSVGPAVVAIGFTTFGFAFNNSGGSYVHSSWLGQYPLGATVDGHAPDPTAVVIQLTGQEHDCYVQNTIIFSGRTGILSQNGANQFEGVHTWNLAAPRGGQGIVLSHSRGRVVNSYLDFCPLVVQSPGGVVASNNLFLGAASIVLASGQSDEASVRPNGAPNPTQVAEVSIVYNVWSDTNATIVLDETQGAFTRVVDTTVEGNVFPWESRTALPVSTRATQTVALNATSGTTVTLRFGASLLFPKLPIQSVSCDVRATEAVSHVVAPTDASGAHPTDVTVILSGAVQSGSLTCAVDQSERRTAAH